MNKILFPFLCIILIACQSKQIQLTFDCSHSKLQPIESEEEAIKIGIGYLNSKRQSKYIYEDSVRVFHSLNDSTIYEIGFLRKEMVLPPYILLLIRKEDGCVEQALLE